MKGFLVLTHFAFCFTLQCRQLLLSLLSTLNGSIFVIFVPFCDIFSASNSALIRVNSRFTILFPGNITFLTICALIR